MLFSVHLRHREDDDCVTTLEAVRRMMNEGKQIEATDFQQRE